jgi:potassium-dependent mechanosensitive channel
LAPTGHLIPDANLITGEVINWSCRQDHVRIKVHLGISYDADLEKAGGLILEAACN